MSHAVQGQPEWMGHGGPFWQNVVHWRRKLQTTSAFLPWDPHELYEKKKKNNLEWVAILFSRGVFPTPSGEGNGNQYSSALA